MPEATECYRFSTCVAAKMSLLSQSPDYSDLVKSLVRKLVTILVESLVALVWV